MAIKIGDKLPAGTLWEFIDEETPGCSIGPNSFKVEELVRDKRIAIFGLPGAFTPTCSAKHLPGFKQLAGEIKGKGVDIAVFELSGYLHSDIATWSHQFYGPGYNPPLVDVNVDGGPLAPQCPVGDTCPPEFNGYAGDIEVVADIETHLILSPSGARTIVEETDHSVEQVRKLADHQYNYKDIGASISSGSYKTEGMLVAPCSVTR
jgi:hypothetical protein